MMFNHLGSYGDVKSEDDNNSINYYFLNHV